MLVLLVVWGVAWGLLETGQGKSSREMATMPGTALAEPAMVPMSEASALDKFVRFAQADQGLRAGQTQEYTQTGIYLLTGALRRELAQRPTPPAAVAQRQHALQTLADRMDALPRIPAGLVREASLATADLLAAMQAAQYPVTPAQVDTVRTAALAIQPQGTLRDQGPALQAFFKHAASAVAPMAAPMAKT